MTPTEHQAFGLLVREMRYIAGISSGQVHRIAMMTLEKVATLSPAQAVNEKGTQNVSTLEQPQADDLLQDVAAYIGVGGYNGATPQQLADRIRAEFDRLQPQAQGELGEIIGCFDAAIAEGLFEVMAETTDGRLKDLLERRLMHAYYAAKAVSEGDSAPTTVQQAANELIALAYRAGQVVTIERRPLKPLAMGNSEYVVDIRPVRGAS